MTFIEYMELEEGERIDLLYNYGNHVDTIRTADTEYRLYLLYSFYVEVLIDVKGLFTKQINTFCEGSRLFKYSRLS